MPKLEDVIAAEIERCYLTRPKPTLAQFVRSINYACHEQGLRAPTRKTIGSRVAAIGKKRSIEARDGAKIGCKALLERVGLAAGPPFLSSPAPTF